MDTLLVTFVYPAVVDFLEGFLSNCDNQTFKPSKVLFFNDGVVNLEAYLSNFSIPWESIPVNGTIVENRLFALEDLKKRPQANIVFQDADDLMSVNRVEKVVDYLKTHQLVVNDLDIMNADGVVTNEKYWSERLDNGFIFDHHFIEKLNIVGFGNTALQSQLLKTELSNSRVAPLAADWFVFYQLLEKSNSKGIFINEGTTLYRQHDNNTAGLGCVTIQRINHAFEVKKKHYQALQECGYDCAELLKEIEINQKVTYKNNLFNIKKPLFWWEETTLIV